MIEQLKNAKTWEERYRLIIQAGKNLPRPCDEELAEMQPINGCVAPRWCHILPPAERSFTVGAGSAARGLSGVLWILLNQINGKSVEQLRNFDLGAFFNELGIAQRLSETRLNGLNQIAQQLKNLCI